MSYDYRKLKGRIIEICGTQEEFARRMNLSTRTVSLKLNGKLPWKQSEITKAIEVLELEDSDIQAYFFTLEVQSD